MVQKYKAMIKQHIPTDLYLAQAFSGRNVKYLPFICFFAFQSHWEDEI